MNTLTGVITNPLKRGGKGFQIKPDNDDNDNDNDCNDDNQGGNDDKNIVLECKF